MRKQIFLHGWLGEKYGYEPRTLDADNIFVVISGLCGDNPRMRNDILVSDNAIILHNDDNDFFALEPELININLNNYKNLHIIPKLEGGGPLIPVLLIVGEAIATAAAAAAE